MSHHDRWISRRHRLLNGRWLCFSCCHRRVGRAWGEIRYDSRFRARTHTHTLQIAATQRAPDRHMNQPTTSHCLVWSSCCRFNESSCCQSFCPAPERPWQESASKYLLPVRHIHTQSVSCQLCVGRVRDPPTNARWAHSDHLRVRPLISWNSTICSIPRLVFWLHLKLVTDTSFGGATTSSPRVTLCTPSMRVVRVCFHLTGEATFEAVPLANTYPILAAGLCATV